MDDEALVAAVLARLVDDDDDPAAAASRHLASLAPLLHVEHRQRLEQRAVAEVTGLGGLQHLLDDPDVDEIMVNGARDVWVERCGRLERVGRLAPNRLDVLIERVLAPIGRRLDRSSPVVDARLADGSRVCAIAPPVAVDGTCLCIRRFKVRSLPLEAFGAADVVQLLDNVIRSRCNVVVAGATSAGKTTLLNSLAGRVPRGERLVSLEDTAELRLDGDHVVRLEARPAMADGPPAVDLHQLLRAALRLRPDRLVVGEVRGAEALDLLQALNTGHDGSMATVHANSPNDTVRRLTSMVLQAGTFPVDVVNELVRSAIDVVVQVGRGSDGVRLVTHVYELAPPAESGPVTRPIFGPTGCVGVLTRGRVSA